MESIADRIKAAKKAGKGESLTPTKYEPSDGSILAGEFIHREVITAKGSTKTFELVTVRSDTGLVQTIVDSGTFAMGEKPLVKGDILEFTYHAEKSEDATKKPFMRASVMIYHTGSGDPLPF